MELGIIGLPNSSKTTIFNALTRGDLPTSATSSGKLEFHTAVVDVPDPRVDALSALFKPRKTTYAKVTYTDIAGLDQGMAQKGLSGQLRHRLSQMDAFIHVCAPLKIPASAIRWVRSTPSAIWRSWTRR